MSKSRKKPELQENADPVDNVILNEDQAADNAASVAMKPTNKSEAIAAAINVMSAMQGDEALNFFKETFGSIGHEADNIPADAAARNAASIAMKAALKEDITNLFAGLEGAEPLSEQFQEKALTLFEAVVSSRLAIEKEELEEQYQDKLNKQTEAIANGLIENINDYISYAAEQWLADNQVAVESTLKSEITEELLEGLQGVFAAHNIAVPEAKVDVVEALTKQLEDAKAALNERTEEVISLRSALDEAARADIIEAASEGLTQVQKGRLVQLTEDLDAESTEAFASKVAMVKETLAAAKPTAKRSLLTEDVSEEYDNSAAPAAKKPSSPKMSSYVQTAKSLANNR